MRHVIVGNGMAGVAAARTLSRLHPDARITMYTTEPGRFYSRPGLMYHMMGLLKEWDLHLARGDDFYRDLHVDVKYESVARVWKEENLLELASGRGVRFDRLLLAMGSTSRRLQVAGADLDGVHYMYTLEQCRQIMARSRKGRRAVVIGGGLLGAELAEVWRHYGMHVTLLVQDAWYFPKGLDETQGRIVEAEIRRHGVDLRLNARVAEIRGEGKVAAVVTASGEEIPAEVVGVTIGVTPNVAVAQASGLTVNRGIVVNEHLCTSRRHVYAAGDCAEVQRPVHPPLLNMLWYDAEREGEAAARAMCGDDRPYDPGVFHNAAMFFGVDYVATGTSFPGAGEAAEMMVRRDGRAARRLVHRGGVVTGVTSVGAGDDPGLLMELVERGTHVQAARERLRGKRWTADGSAGSE